MEKKQRMDAIVRYPLLMSLLQPFYNLLNV